MELLERIGCLRENGLFSGLDDIELGRLAARCAALRLPANRPVNGGRGLALYLVHDGAVAVAHDAVGQPVQPPVPLRRGESFGEIGLFDERHERPVARTLEPSLLLRIPLPVLRDVLQRHPDLRGRLEAVAAERRGLRVLHNTALRQRREVRIRVDTPIVLELEGGRSHSARLTSLSLAGMSLENAPPAWQPDDEVRFGLGLPQGQLQLAARVVWREENRLGLSLIKEDPNHDALVQLAIRLLSGE